MQIFSSEFSIECLQPIEFNVEKVLNSSLMTTFRHDVEVRVRVVPRAEDRAADVVERRGDAAAVERQRGWGERDFSNVLQLFAF